jgi:hypothetical protein
VARLSEHAQAATGFDHSMQLLLPAHRPVANTQAKARMGR